MGEMTTLSPRVRLFSIGELEGIVRMKKSAIYEKVAAGKFPRPFKVGRQNVWRESTLISYLESLDRKAGNR